MITHRSAAQWIEDLHLKPHPEGGHYREIYRSAGQIGQDFLPEGMEGNRNYATSIYYLLEAGDVSLFHRIKSDELWFFHSGAPLEIVVLNKDGTIDTHILGLDVEVGQQPQLTVPAGLWFGARLPPHFASYGLVSCVVSPGFDFEDFQLATPEDIEKWPAMRRCPDLCPPLH